MSQKSRLAAPRYRHFADRTGDFLWSCDWKDESRSPEPSLSSSDSSLRAPNERRDLQAVWNRHRHVASRHLPTTDNWHLFLLRQDRSLDVKLGQIIECQCWTKWRLMCTVCHPYVINPLKPELNPICYLLALLGAHHFLHLSRIRVKLLTFRWLMSYIYGAPILDVSRSHTTTQHSR